MGIIVDGFITCELELLVLHTAALLIVWYSTSAASQEMDMVSKQL